MATRRQVTAAKKNIKKARASAQKRRSIANMPAKTRSALGRQGAAVAVNYRNRAAEAEAVAADIVAGGSRALAIGGDVSEPGEAEQVAKTATAAFGDIDVLVCSAFGSTDGMIERHRPGSSTLDAAAIEAVLGRAHVQLAATLYACRAVVPGMRRRGGGSIVLIGAAGSRGGQNAGPAEIVAAKAAQDALARVLAEELGPDRIRVNVIAPGMVPTDANAGQRQEFIMAALGKMTPLGRVAGVDDVADAVLAFATDLTRHVTGAYVPVDGGRILL